MKHSARKLDPDKLRQYVRRHPDATQRQIAAYFGCIPAYVSYLLKQYGIPYTRKYKYNKIQMEKLRKFVRKHPDATQQEIAAHLRCGQTSVGYALRRYNIPYKRKCRAKIKHRNNSEIPPNELRRYVSDHPEATQGQIAAYFSRNQSSISTTLKRYGIPYVKKCPCSKITENELRVYVKEHPEATQQQIAKYFGCSQYSISDALKRYDIPYAKKTRARVTTKLDNPAT